MRWGAINYLLLLLLNGTIGNDSSGENQIRQMTQLAMAALEKVKEMT